MTELLNIWKTLAGRFGTDYVGNTTPTSGHWGKIQAVGADAVVASLTSGDPDGNNVYVEEALTIPENGTITGWFTAIQLTSGAVRLFRNEYAAND